MASAMGKVAKLVQGSPVLHPVSQNVNIFYVDSINNQNQEINTDNT